MAIKQKKSRTPSIKKHVTFAKSFGVTDDGFTLKKCVLVHNRGRIQGGGNWGHVVGRNVSLTMYDFVNFVLTNRVI